MTILKATYQGIMKISLLACLFVVPVIGLSQATDLPAVVEEAKKAGIETSVIEEIKTRARQGGLADEQIADLIRPAVGLAKQNLPSDMVFKKALEGLSKNIPANRIAGVLQNIGEATQRSAPVVDGWMSRSDVASQIAGSSAMSEEAFRNEMISSVTKGVSQGVPEEEISALLNDISSSGVVPKTTPQSISTAVRIFSELPTTAEAPGMSRDFIVRSLKNGFDSSELQKLPGAMAVAQRRSQLPAASVIEGVSKQLQGGVPAKQILQSLFNGKIGGGPPGSVPQGLDNKPDNNGSNG